MGEGPRSIPKWAWVVLGLPLLCGGFAVALSIASSVFLPSLVEKIDAVNRAEAGSELPLLWGLVDDYAAQHGAPPADAADLVLPDDPWGNPYVYQPKSEGRPERLISYGMDRAPGGEGYDADVVDER
jgi:general secretion pathway protein G